MQTTAFTDVKKFYDDNKTETSGRYEKISACEEQNGFSLACGK
jgi:hypothetical protein